MSLIQTPVLISSGTSLSAEVDLGNKVLVGIAMPAAAWTAAVLTFQASFDGGVTWLNMQTASAELSYTASFGQYIAVDPTLWRGVNAIKVRSGTAGTPVSQAVNATLTLITS
jgi:hypothetical protein